MTLPTAAEALQDARRPRLPPGAEYLLVPTPDRMLAKSIVRPSLRSLAELVHRRREGAAIELADAPLLARGEARERFGVSVWTLGPDGARAAYLGWVYLGGAGRRALETALEAVEPRAQLAEVA